jgi:hypothetical protein
LSGSEVEEDSSSPAYSISDQELIKQNNSEHVRNIKPKPPEASSQPSVPPTQKIPTATKALPIQQSSSEPATAGSWSCQESKHKD